MITVRPSSARGSTKLGWLDSRHTFSFGRYYDPAFESFGALRVINDDRVAPGRGFSPHDHQNMEILSYVLSGGLAHKDSTGTARVIGPRDVQHMSAGRGVTHSEFNPSQTEPTHFFQIWVVPNAIDATPTYNELKYDPAARADTLQLIASPDGASGSIRWNSDTRLYTGVLSAGKQIGLDLAADRRAWVQVMRGGISLNGVALSEGDGAAISAESRLSLTGGAGESDILIFDLK
jgi:redox-sensitive bicupin YhaK (pirin superfamily)